jgi:hypothetical protein
MEAAGSSEMLVTFSQTTPRHFPDDGNLHLHLCKILNLATTSLCFLTGEGKGKAIPVIGHEGP